MKIRFDRYLAINLYFLLHVGGLAYMLRRQLIEKFDKGSWGVTEFLINYQGGFVRRGLLGEGLYQAWRHWGIDPYTVIIAISLGAYSLLVAYFLRQFLRNGYSLFLLPMVFLLGNPIVNQFWVRKDSIILLFFITILHFTLRRPRFYLWVVHALTITGILIHESLGYILFPILFWLIYQRACGDVTMVQFRMRAALKVIWMLLPSLLTFALITAFHGNEQVAQAIWDSWKTVPFPKQLADPAKLPASINGISWSLSKGLSYFTDMLRAFPDGIYAPFIWALTFGSIFTILSNAHRINFPTLFLKPKNFLHQGVISTALLFQLAAIIPLIVLGADHGRWIFLWTCSSLVIYLELGPQRSRHSLPPIFSRIGERILQHFEPTTNKSFLFLLTIILGFPTVYWSLDRSMTKSSIVLVTKSFSKGLQFFMELF